MTAHVTPTSLTASRRRFFACLVLASATALGAADPEPLRLRGTLGGTPVENLSVKKGQLVATVGKQTGVLPPRVDWSLEGDLRANAGMLLLSPAYSTERVSSLASRAATMSGYTHLAKISLQYAPGPDLPWPGKTIDGGVLVFLWLSAGQPTRIEAAAVTNLLEPQDRVTRMDFLMDQREAENGFPAILLWKDGRFITPRPWFRNAEVNRWLIAAHFPDGEALPSPAPTIATSRGVHAITPLHIAAESGLDTAVALLLAAGAKPMTGDRNGRTPGHWAAGVGRTGALRQLAAAGANLDRETSQSYSPIRQLLRARHDSAAAALVGLGVRVDQLVGDVSAAELALELGLMETLRAIAAKEGLQPLRRHFGPRLAAAVRTGETDLVSFLLQQGADSNHRQRDEPVLALAARRSGGAELCKLLLEARADPNATGREGTTALAAAARVGDSATAAALLAAQADPNRADRAGRTPLHFAVATADPRIASALLDAGARVDASDEQGMTALEIALVRQMRPMVGVLLNAGARIDLKSKSASRLLGDAIVLNFPDLLERAARDGWPPNGGVPAIAHSPLALARYAGATEAAGWLMRHAPGLTDEIATVGPGDAPPEIITAKPPVDPRNDRIVYPATEVMVAGIAEVDGSFAHAIVATRDETLRVAVLEAVRGWRFKPMRKAGVAVPVAVKFPVGFAAKDNEIYPTNQIDVPPDVRRTSNVIQLIAEQLATGGPRFHGGSMVGFVIEKDGRASGVTVPENLPEDYAANLRRMVEESQFSPGLRRGQPVRTWVEMLVGFDLKVTYVVDDSYRFNLSGRQ